MILFYFFHRYFPIVIPSFLFCIFYPESRCFCVDVFIIEKGKLRILFTHVIYVLMLSFGKGRA